MKATLFLPNEEPIEVPVEGLHLPDASTGFVPASIAAASLLGCNPNLVDILACGPEYVAYSVFGCEAGPPNKLAKEKISLITDVPFNLEDEEAELYGAILIVQSQEK